MIPGVDRTTFLQYSGLGLAAASAGSMLGGCRDRYDTEAGV